MQWLGCTHGSRFSISREGTEGNGHPIPIPVRPSPLPAIPSIVPPPQTDFGRAGRLSTEAALRRSCLAHLSLSLSLACAHTLIFSSLMIPAFLFLFVVGSAVPVSITVTRQTPNGALLSVEPHPPTDGGRCAVRVPPKKVAWERSRSHTAGGLFISSCGSCGVGGFGISLRHCRTRNLSSRLSSTC